MKSLAQFILPVLLLAAATGTTSAGEKKHQPIEPFSIDKQYLMAVMPFEDKTKEQKYGYLGNQIADQLISGIFPYKRFRLIERERLTAIIDELQIQQTDYFKKEFVSKIGNQLGAEVMLAGSIIDILQKTEKRSIGLASKEETTLSISLEARIIRIDTGEILSISKWTEKEVFSKKQALAAVKDDSRKSEDLIADAVRNAVVEIAYELCKNAPSKQ
jgi:curli biogenesis system outer membrane secretion channel CsgG